MRILKISFFLTILPLSFVHAGIRANEFEFSAYMRAGTGSNGKGAAKECFSNSGSPGNEFRLGNECSIYGELAFGAHLLEAKESDPFFRTQVRFAFNPPGYQLFEGASANNGGGHIVEAYAEGGRLEGSPLVFWAGKRFYRSVDLHMYDWYYFMDMSGNGAGVSRIPLGSGHLSLALLFQVGSTATNLGTNSLQVLDARWEEIVLGENHRLHLWLAYGEAPGGTSTTGTRYVKNNGYLAGARWRRNLSSGFHDLTVARGYRLLEGMNLYGSTATVDELQKPWNAERWRFVNHIFTSVSPKLSFESALVAELVNRKNPYADSRLTWLSVGVRPVYYFGKFWQLAFEAGHSIVTDQTERNANGSFVGNRHLTRFTIAPQIAPRADYWARPLLRIYYSRSFWNKANQSSVARGAPSYGGATSGQSIGVQTEVWF